MMTIPGLALFYGGLLKKDNVLATLMQSLAVCAVVSVVWPVIGYSLAFVGDGRWLGTLDRWFLAGLTMDSVNPAANAAVNSAVRMKVPSVFEHSLSIGHLRIEH